MVEKREENLQEDLQNDLQQNEKTDGAWSSLSKKSNWAKKMFSAKRCAVMALFSALALTVSFFEFPIFPATAFLQLDFGNCFIMLVGFLLGPIESLIVCVVKETLRILLKNGTGGVGELANMLVTSAYILLPATAYYFKKGLKVVVPTLIAGCFIAAGVALLVNRFVLFPAYMGNGGADAFAQVWGFVLLFNLIKGAANTVLTIILYKRLSFLFKKWKI